jgi:hypothetical protein
MDDLMLLRKVRASEPGPSVAQSAAARQALAHAIARAETVPGPAGRSGPGRSGVRFRPVPSGRVWLSAAAGIAIAVGAAVPVTLDLSDHAGHPASRHRLANIASGTASPRVPTFQAATLTAAEVLDRAASAALGQPLRDGRYFFTESEVISETTVGGQIRLRRGPGGKLIRPSPQALRKAAESQRLVREPTYLRTMWLGNGVSSYLKQPADVGGARSLPSGVEIPFGDLSWAQVRSLPTATSPLRAFIVQHAQGLYPKYPNAIGFGEFSVITSLLYESPAPPALRHALYRLAAQIPGTRAVDTVDLVGRPAIEIYLQPGRQDPPGHGQALFFSPATYSLLGWGATSPAGPQCPMPGEYAILSTGYVNSTSQVPPGTASSVLPTSYPVTVRGCPPAAPVG